MPWDSLAALIALSASLPTQQPVHDLMRAGEVSTSIGSCESSVTNFGDLNGDGIDDLIAGAKTSPTSRCRGRSSSSENRRCHGSQPGCARGKMRSMQWFVYVIWSPHIERSYVGIAIDPQRRLRQHNGDIKGGAKSTRAGRPWQLRIAYGPFTNRSSASIAEYAIKQRRGEERWATNDLPYLVAESPGAMPDRLAKGDPACE